MIETPFRTEEETANRWHHTEVNFALPTQTIKQVEERVAVVDDALLTRWNIDRNKAGSKAIMNVMWAIREYNVGAAVAKIRRPALLLFGKRGPTIAGQARFLAANPKLPVEILENSGHFPMLDEPAAFADALIRFCSSAAKSAKAKKAPARNKSKSKR